MSRLLVVLAAALCLSAPTGAAAQSAGTALSDLDRSVFFFGGRFHSDWFGNGLNPFIVDWEDNFIAAVGYQQEALRFDDWSIGGEFGLGGRFGMPENSFEVWAGGYVRYDGFTLGNVRISPSFTMGLSAASSPIGIEADRAGWIGLDTVPLLIYLGPELNFSFVDKPELEVFWRLQHRSGGFGYIADIDGANADVIGIRYRF